MAVEGGDNAEDWEEVSDEEVEGLDKSEEEIEL